LLILDKLALGLDLVEHVAENLVVNTHFISFSNSHDDNLISIQNHSMAESTQWLLFRHGYDLVVAGELDFAGDHRRIKDKSVHFLVDFEHPGEAFFGLLDVFTHIFDIIVDGGDFILFVHELGKRK
jgi:hypothetical protein